jgi:hypothetical protein
MKSLKLLYVMLILAVIFGCENKVEKAKSLWEQKKQSEAINTLNMEISKNPKNIDANKLLEQYNILQNTSEFNNLWESGKKLQAIELLRNMKNRYPNNSEVDALLLKNFQNRNTFKGKIVDDYVFKGILPIDDTAFPLLSNIPSNSFAFVIFYSEQEIKQYLSPTSVEKNSIILKNEESSKESVRLSKIKGFNDYLAKLQTLSRYDITDKINDITSNLIDAYHLYTAEYEKYLCSIFEISESEGLSIENDYDLDNQRLELNLIGSSFFNAFTYYNGGSSVDDRFLFLGASGYWRSKTFKVELPSSIAKNLASKTRQITSQIEYKYIIEPVPNVIRHTGFLHEWIPLFNMHEIIITLKNNEGNTIVNYKLENISEKTVDYTPSFNNKKQQAIFLRE